MKVCLQGMSRVTYGCGGGGWCKEVEEEVYKVVGVYEANAMMMMVIEVTNGH